MSNKIYFLSEYHLEQGELVSEGKKNYKIERVTQIGRTEMIVIDENGNAIAVADGRGDDSVAVE